MFVAERPFFRHLFLATACCGALGRLCRFGDRSDVTYIGTCFIPHLNQTESEERREQCCYEEGQCNTYIVVGGPEASYVASAGIFQRMQLYHHAVRLIDTSLKMEALRNDLS